MQDAIAAFGEKTADASQQAEGKGAVGNEQYIYKLFDGRQFADCVEVCFCGSADAALFIFLRAMIIYSELNRSSKNTTVVFTDYFVP